MMAVLKDQIGNPVKLESVPRRIISLVPSITEYLFDLGLEKRVVGITKFCVHPCHWRKEKEIVGGTKQQDLEKIKRLNPDLIIASKEENVKQYVEKLANICPVYVSDVADLSSALKMMDDVGYLTQRQNASNDIVKIIKRKFEQLEKPNSKIKTAYCIWKNPWMWAGSDTFISRMLDSCGMENIIKKERYPEVELSNIADKKPDYVFLSSEPFPFQEKHLLELEKEFPSTNFRIVDGEMFSWYGSRMLKAPDYFNSLINQLETK